MSEERIFHKVEKTMHIFFFYFVLLINVFALAKFTINSGTTATTCTYAATPTGCRLQDDVECDENMDYLQRENVANLEKNDDQRRIVKIKDSKQKIDHSRLGHGPPNFATRGHFSSK